MRGTIPQAGPIGENRVIEEGGSIGLPDGFHPLQKVGELLHVELVDFEQVVDVFALIMGHPVMTARFFEEALE